jgi:hypothetical protein
MTPARTVEMLEAIKCMGYTRNQSRTTPNLQIDTRLGSPASRSPWPCAGGVRRGKGDCWYRDRQLRARTMRWAEAKWASAVHDQATIDAERLSRHVIRAR